MEYVLTPLVTRFLRQYVKRSSEGAGSNLKVGALQHRHRCERHRRCRLGCCWRGQLTQHPLQR